MIKRFYLKDYLSFKELELEFKEGLVVFTGPSGAGKSILFNTILSLFGAASSKATIAEVLLEKTSIKNIAYGIEKDDDIIIKQLNQSKLRYFLNNQIISKKNLHSFSQSFAKYLHLKDTSDFDSDKIINFLDFLSMKLDDSYVQLKDEFDSTYKEYSSIVKQLTKIEKDEQDLENLIEYAKFEIQKIESIDPKEDEYDELKQIKSDLSKKDKLKNILNEASIFLNNTHKISQALELIDEDSSFFDETINEVNSIFENFYDKLSSIEDMNVEEVLDRIEQLSSLIKRFGTIENAIKYKEQKQKELQSYENISFEKAILEKNKKKFFTTLETLAKEISIKREKSLEIFIQKIEQYLDNLYLSNLQIVLKEKPLDQSGIDKVEFSLNNTDLSSISSGEFNRLRLALLTARSFWEIDSKGVLFLDEIDANLSGKESQSVATVLVELSKNYQIFAISHQPQLSAKANQHFMVQKENNISTVINLTKDQRINEIARMISGETITKEAIKFAKKLL